MKHGLNEHIFRLSRPALEKAVVENHVRAVQLGPTFDDRRRPTTELVIRLTATFAPVFR